MATATALSGFHPTWVRASHPRADPSRRRPSPSSNWSWTPLFNWPSDPDYISPPDPSRKQPDPPLPDQEKPRSRSSLGCFTEDKARQLRRKTTGTSAFHDAMYHSAIASRLAFADASDDDGDI